MNQPEMSEFVELNWRIWHIIQVLIEYKFGFSWKQATHIL